MNPWAILAIEPTREEREIKRAYTRKLRQHPPETDPDGFKALRAAYEHALSFARLGGETFAAQAPQRDPSPDDPLAPSPGSAPDPSSGPIPEPEMAGLPEASPPVPADGAVRRLRSDSPPTWLSEAQSLLRRIREDFPDHSKRQFRSYWESILDIPLLWNLDAKGWVGWNLVEFLGQNVRTNLGPDFDVHIGTEAWIFLDATFGWLECESQLYAAFGEEIANAVLDPIRAAKGMKRFADLGTANRRAAELANIERRSFLPRGFGLMMSLALIVIGNLFHTCGQDAPSRYHYHSADPSRYQSRPYFSPKPTPGSHPQVFLNPHSLDLETTPPPSSDTH